MWDAHLVHKISVPLFSRRNGLTAEALLSIDRPLGPITKQNIMSIQYLILLAQLVKS